MVTFKKLGKFGRLGNQLFQYAGTRLYAEQNGFKHSFPAWIGNDVFKSISKYTVLERLASKFLPTVQLDDVNSYTRTDKVKYLLGLHKNLPETISMAELYKNPRDNINLYGYLQGEKSLEILKNNKEKVMEWFTFKKYISDSYEQLTANYKPYIGLHIRRGDLVKRDATIPTEDYIEVLNKIRNGRNLFIATDDPKLLSELSHLKPFIIKNPLPEIPDYIFDFFMLKNAATVIGGGSTFSWWASYLGSGDYHSPPLSHLWGKEGKRFKKWEL